MFSSTFVRRTHHLPSLPFVVVYLCALGCGSDLASSPADGGASSTGGRAWTAGQGGLNAGQGGSALSGGASGGAQTSGTSGASGESGANTTGGAGQAGATGGGSGATAIATPVGYTLVWHDEFETDGAPNPSNYNFERGFLRNEEAQFYQAGNATVKNGLLVIEARRETVANPNYTGSGDWKTSRKEAAYTSASLTTSGKQSFQYGRFEMRARIPTEAGLWPAWWTLGVKGQWPSNGEIDIMEYYQGKVLANVACGTGTAWQAKWDSIATPLSSLGANWAAQFHVWSMDWDQQKIVLAVDGNVLNASTLSSMLNSDGTSPFNQKAYLLVNLALGGLNGGDPSRTTFPKQYEIDYLRVFQKR